MSEYSLDKLLDIKRLLTKYVGEEVAAEWIRDRFDRSVQYDLPVVKENGKSRYTAYGELKNLDVRPARYAPPESTTVTLVPTKDWYKADKGGAAGEYSVLGGIRMPRARLMDSQHPSENVLVHEGVHAREMQSSNNPLNLRREDVGLLGETAKYMLNIQGVGRNAITGRQQIGEVIPELVDYESRLPAWRRLQATDFFKDLPNNIQAMLMRRFFPMPQGVDAMVGQGYD